MQNSADPWAARFRSRTRVRTLLFAFVPLADTILLACAFVLFSLAFAKRPGMVVELPQGRADDGMRSSLHLAAKPAQHSDTVFTDAGAAMTTAALIVFFDESLYDLRLEYEASALIAAVAAKAAASHETGILLHIDKSVPHGDTMALSRMLRLAGIERLCFVIDTNNSDM